MCVALDLSTHMLHGLCGQASENLAKCYLILSCCYRWVHTEIDHFMPKLNLLKITRDTNIWKKGQKVWVVYYTGDLAYKCIGRFRGNGRWVMAWAHSDSANRDAKWLGEVDVSEQFYNNYCSIVAKIVKNEYWNVHGI